MRTLDRAATVPEPNGCSWCGLDQRGHAQQWKASTGWHKWEQPTQAQIKERMTRRREDRLFGTPTVYHATTAWAADHTGEDPIAFCADCKTDACRRWMRTQERLDRQRWNLPRPGRRSSGGWGADEPLPF